MEQNKRKTVSTFPAPESTCSFNKISDTTQKKEELNAERNEKHQTSILDELLTTEQDLLEEVVQGSERWHESKIHLFPQKPPSCLQINKRMFTSTQRLTHPHIHNLESGLGPLTSDAPLAWKENLNEDKKESIFKNQGCQTSISKKLWNEMSVGGAWSRPSPSDSPFSLSSQDSWLDNRRHYPNYAANANLEKRDHVLPTKAHSGPTFKVSDTPLSFSSSSDKSLKDLSQSKVILPSVASRLFRQKSTMFPDGPSKENRKEKAYPSKVAEPELPRPYGLTPVCADLQRCSSDTTGESLKKDAFELAAQSQSELGGDHSSVKKLRPLVILKRISIKNSLPVCYQLQQPPESSLERTADLYSPDPRTSSPYFIPHGSVVHDLPKTHAQGPSLDSPLPFWSSFCSKLFKIKCTEASHSIGSLDDYRSAAKVFYQPHFILPETGMIKNQSPAADASTAVSQYNTREMDLHETTGPSTLQLFTSDDDDPDSAAFDERTKVSYEMSPDSPPSLVTDYMLHLPSRKETDDGDPNFDNYCSDFGIPSCSQSAAPTVHGPPCPQDSPVVLQDSNVCTEGSRAQDAFELLSVQSEGESEDVSDAVVEMEASVTAVKSSVTDTQPAQCLLQLSSSDPGWSERDSSCLSRSHSVPSLSQTTSPENKTFTPSQSLPDLLLKSSFEEFTPDISVDEDDETYWFQCSCPGLYQCSVTGLVFHMEGEGDVVYRTVPWDRRLLAQHHKKPAGPLFDIKCLQQSVCQLHLPHCEIRSTGGCEFLSVAHVNDEGIEFIVPQKITETHVIINITGFSAFGNVKDEDSPPDPSRALVLLFYRPPADPDSDPESLLNVLLLPKNVVIPDVLRTRKRLVGNEIYIETSSHCKLSPNHEYTLSMCPEDDSVLVQPTEAEFDCVSYDNYVPSFQVILEKLMKYIKLFLRENKSSKSVWERRVCLSSTAAKRSCGLSALNLPPNDRLLDIRISFINGISGPVLKGVLDKLLEKTVLTDSERESADGIQNHRDKARFVVDTVRKKGEAASSEMIQFLCEIDPFFCEHLGLI